MKWWRRLLLLVLLGAAVAAVAQRRQPQRPLLSVVPPPREPAPAAPFAPDAPSAPTFVDLTPAASPAVVAEPQPEPPPGEHPGSVRALASGEAPGPEYPIKGNADSMIFHTPDSPSYERTVAEVWFATEEDAVAAGFRAPKRRGRPREA